MSSKDTKIGATVKNTSDCDAPPVVGDWEWEEYGSFESKMDRLGGALGITFFVLLLMAALAAYKTFDLTPETWFRSDYKWVLTSAAGLFASLGVLMALRKSGMKREGRTSTDLTKTISIVLLNIVALATSGFVFGWIVYNWIEGTSSPRPDSLYFGSTVGIALVMASLSISGKGTSFDRIASVSLAAASAAVFLLPLVAGDELFSEQNLLVSVYVVAAFASVAGGLITLRTSRIRYRSEEPGRRYGVLMGVSILVAGALALGVDSSGETEILLRDLRWLLPPVVGLAVSLLLLADSRSEGVNRSMNISFIAAFVSAVCIAIPVFDMSGVMVIDDASWLYPLSLVFVPLCMLAAFGVGRDRDKVPRLSLVLSALPALLFVAVWLGGAMDGLSELDAAWTYFGLYCVSFVLVAVSGLGSDSAIMEGDFTRLVRFTRFSFTSVLVAMAFAAYLSGRSDMADHKYYLGVALWLLPSIAGLCASVAVIAAILVPYRHLSLPSRLLVPLVFSAGALVASAWSMVLGDSHGVFDQAVPAFLEGYSVAPLACSMAILSGMSLMLLAIGLARTGTWVDYTLTLLTSLSAPLFVLVFYLLSGGGDVPPIESLLVAAALLLLSSFRLHTWYSGALVTREKISINFRNMAKISKQVIRNPMGAIGLGILVFFVMIAIFGPSLAPEKIVNPSGAGSFDRLMPPSPEHWMGTDNKGFDILSQLLYGGRTSMIVGITAAMIASILGATIGLYSGYKGGWIDEVIMRLNDVVLSIPWLVLMIIIAAYLGEINLFGIILIIGLTGWSATARLVRAQVLSLRERQFVERARAIGCSDGAIIRRHILPNSFPLVFANTILTVAVAILSEATLSFLRMRPNDVVTWGAMLSEAFESSAFYIGFHWWIIAPGLCIVLVVLGFTLIGFALDEILNPKLRKR